MNAEDFISFHDEQWEMRPASLGYCCEQEGCNNTAEHDLLARENDGRLLVCDGCLMKLVRQERKYIDLLKALIANPRKPEN